MSKDINSREYYYSLILAMNYEIATLSKSLLRLKEIKKKLEHSYRKATEEEKEEE